MSEHANYPLSTDDAILDVFFDDYAERILEQLEESLPSPGETVELFDHRIYAAVGRVMEEDGTYGRSHQENSTDMFIDRSEGILSQAGYLFHGVELTPDNAFGVRHRYVIVENPA